MAAIDFPDSPTLNQQFTAANGAIYLWNGTAWITTGGQGATTIYVSDTPPVSPLPNSLWWNSTLGQLFLWYTDPNTSQWVATSPTATGSVVQQVQTYETGAVATGTTIIPADDTIPQITEGNEYMTLTITPKSASSKLIIEVVWVGSNSAVNNVIVALFQDAAANALAAVYTYMASAGGVVVLAFKHVMTSGTTSSTTFRVRAGGSLAGTTTFNGSSSVRGFGGVLASSIVIQEVLA